MKVLMRLLFVISIILTWCIGTLIIFIPEIIYYMIRYIFTGKSFSDTPIVIIWIEKVYGYFEDKM